MSQQQLDLHTFLYTRSQHIHDAAETDSTDSTDSDSVAFDAELDERDVFLGIRRCVICGEDFPESLERCHIIGCEDLGVWTFLKQSGCVPPGAKGSPVHEVRNGLIMCRNHHTLFDGFHFFIRFHEDTGKFILLTHDSYNIPQFLKPFHGKAIALDINHTHAPLPLFFMVHEYMVQGQNFYQPTNLSITSQWQDWIIDDGIGSSNGTFNNNTRAASSGAVRQSVQLQGSSHAPGPSDSQIIIMPPTADLIERLKVFQHTLPSWKVWEKETRSWEGTAKENTQKYIENIGVQLD